MVKLLKKYFNIPVIAGFIAVIVIAFILFIPIYYRFIFDSIISNGNENEILALINSSKFLKYSSNEQAMRVIDYYIDNFQDKDNQMFSIFDKPIFIKYGENSQGEKIIDKIQNNIDKGNNELIYCFLDNQNFEKYGNKDLAENLLKNVVYNLSDKKPNDCYEFLNSNCFKKYGNNELGVVVVASMAAVILSGTIDEKLYFLENYNIKLYLNQENRKLLIDSIISFPVSELNNKQLDTFFIDICNENEVAIVCNSVKENVSNLPDKFLKWSIDKIQNKTTTTTKIKFIDEMIKKYGSTKSYLRLYAYEAVQSNRENNSEFKTRMERIFNSFSWAFSNEVINVYENVKNGIISLQEFEKSFNISEIKNEFLRLNEKKKQLTYAGSGELRAYVVGLNKLRFLDKDGKKYYLIYPKYGGGYVFVTSKRQFASEGHFVLKNVLRKKWNFTKEQEERIKEKGILNFSQEEEIKNYSKHFKWYTDFSINTSEYFEEVSSEEINAIFNEKKELTRKINELNEKYKNYLIYKLRRVRKIEENKNLLLCLLENKQKYKTYNNIIIKEIDLEMIKCPVGCFIMGDLNDVFNEEVKPHLVIFTKPFYIGKFEVTQSQFFALMNKNPSWGHKGANYPVDSVIFDDAKDFCEKLNKKYLNQLPVGYKFDLPTEAQWEYACRAGTNTDFNNGKNWNYEPFNFSIAYEKSLKLFNAEYDVVWCNENSRGTNEVGKRKPNFWGIFDMHGNVEELCGDRYNYSDRNYPEVDVYDPKVSNKGEIIVCRGGCARYYLISCKSSSRSFSPSDEHYIGFRVAVVPNETQNISETTINEDLKKIEYTKGIDSYLNKETYNNHGNSNNLLDNSNTLNTSEALNKKDMGVEFGW